MKKTIILVLSIYLMVFSSCKKSTQAPSIAGNWKLTNITGMVVYLGNPGVYDTVIYSYGNANNIYTRTEKYSDPFLFDTINYQVNMENWSFNADGSYSINETYSGNGFTTATYTTTGVWEYLSNTHTNDGLILTGASSALFPTFSKDNNTYTIQTLNSSTLVLTVINDQTSSTIGTIDYNNIVITFSKQ